MDEMIVKIHRFSKLLLAGFAAVLLAVNGYYYYESRMKLASLDLSAPYNLQKQVYQTRTLTFRAENLSEYNQISLYLNGEPCGSLRQEESISIHVKNHDVIQALGEGPELPLQLFLIAGEGIDSQDFETRQQIDRQLKTVAVILD